MHDTLVMWHTHMAKQHVCSCSFSSCCLHIDQGCKQGCKLGSAGLYCVTSLVEVRCCRMSLSLCQGDSVLRCKNGKQGVVPSLLGLLYSTLHGCKRHQASKLKLLNKVLQLPHMCKQYAGLAGLCGHLHLLFWPADCYCRWKALQQS